MNALLSLLIVTGMLYGILINGTFWKLYFALVTVYFIVTHFFLRNGRYNGKRKTILISTWDNANDPTSYLAFEWNMTKTFAYIKKLNEEQKEVKITITHLFAYAAVKGIHKARRDMGRISWGFFKRSKRLGFSVLVNVEGGSDLVPVTIWDGHTMTLLELAKYITAKVDRARQRKDATHEKSTASFNFLPSFIGQPLLFCISYLTTNCGLNVPALGARSDQFGHFVLTNVGPLGLEEGFAPLCPPLHAMGFWAIGCLKKKPVVDDEGNIVVGDVMKAVLTGDHRFGDAAISLPMVRAVEFMWKDPEKFEENLATIPEKVPYEELAAQKKSK